MPNVSHLTGLEVLTASHTYENISDAGLIHIKPLIYASYLSMLLILEILAFHI
jgi:hypothetical protein